MREVLAAAVAALGGQERPGQVEMAEAVAAAMESGEHLLVQAGTGTGKSLGYLVPAMLNDDRVVVATATLALQHQLVERDIPALVEAVKDVLHETPSYAVLKGRSNYACLHRIREGVPDDQGALVELPEGSLGAEVLAMREWVEEEAQDGGTGERDHAPRHTDRIWRQVSVSHRECLGAAKCPYGAECFAERARERAMRSQVVVTNHSLLAIDAVEGVPMIPEYDTVVIDEAHELVARVTQAATDELSVLGGGPDRAPGVSATSTDPRPTTWPTRVTRCATRSTRRRRAGSTPIPQELADALVLVRDAARALVSAFPKDLGDDAVSTQAKGWAQELFKTSERMAANADADVLWVAERDRQRGGNQLCVAPLQVFGTMRDKLLTDKTVVMTSATLKLGGDFDAVATSVGLRPSERVVSSPASDVAERTDGVLPWRGLDVGSPFDYGKQAILYVARHLPPPGRDGLDRGHAPGDRGAGRRRRRAHPRACSPHAGPPRPRPRRCASGCRT